MRKPIMPMVLAILSLAIFAVGASLAYLTNTETLTNVMTVGQIEVALMENGGEDGIPYEDPDTGMTGLTYEKLFPGYAYDKITNVNNLEEAAYVAADITMSGSEILMDAMQEEASAITFLRNGAPISLVWRPVDETDITKGVTATVFYSDADNENAADKDHYGGYAMNADNEDGVWNVFDSFLIPETWNSDFSEIEFHIIVEVKAVQADSIDQSKWYEIFTNQNQTDL